MVLGITAQWLAWRIKLASILLLLLFGIVAGATGVLNTDELLGDLLFPIVSLSIAVILFEGGLSLRWEDVRAIRSVVRNIILLGALVTWVVSSLAAHWLLGMPLSVAFLLGAILVVTGPTVVIPLLKQIRPEARVASILRWEGIIIDPVGAILAVLVFEELVAGQPGLGNFISNLVITLSIGLVLGGVGALVMVELYKRYLVPDNLQNAFTLMIVVGTFALSNTLEAESGLLTVTVLGIIMANQKSVDMHHIIEFKENLQVLLLSALFILLGARLNLNDFAQLGAGAVLFVVVLMGVARPLSIWVASIGSDLNWREKLFLSWMAPRGIVAAAVSSIFALELHEHEIVGADLFVTVTFLVIIVTVTIYSLTAGRLATVLGLREKNPQGVFIAGAHRWARTIASELQKAGFEIIVSDSNLSNIEAARTANLTTYHGNVLSDVILEEMDFSGIGHVLALTANDEVNSLVCLHFKDLFGDREVYQLPHQNMGQGRTEVSQRVGGRDLFDYALTFDTLKLRFSTGATLQAIRIKDIANYDNHCRSAIQPMFIVTPAHDLLIWTAVNPPRPHVGDIVIGLVERTELDVFASQELMEIKDLAAIEPDEALVEVEGI